MKAMAQSQPDARDLDAKVLSDVRAIAPFIAGEAEEAERLGWLTPRCVDLMKGAGLFWMYLPREAGGLGVKPWTAVQIIEELGCAHGAVGWVLMASAMNTGLAYANCGDAAIDLLFGKQKSIMCGYGTPRGVAQVAAGGYDASGGRYFFASGAAHASHFLAGMTVVEDGKPRLLPDGSPEIRVCVVPRDKFEPVGNWNVTGLVPTGSFDIEVREHFISEDFTMLRMPEKPRRPGTVFDIGSRIIVFMSHAAWPLGVMKRCLEEIALVAATKTRPGYAGSFAEDAVFQRDFAAKEAQYRAVRAYLQTTVEDGFDTLRRGNRLTSAQEQAFQQCTLLGHRIGVEIAQFANSWGGSVALRKPSVLSRCLNDMSVATQHIFVDEMHFRDAGKELLPVYRDYAAARHQNTALHRNGAPTAAPA